MVASRLSFGLSLSRPSTFTESVSGDRPIFFISSSILHPPHIKGWCSLENYSHECSLEGRKVLWGLFCAWNWFCERLCTVQRVPPVRSWFLHSLCCRLFRIYLHLLADYMIRVFEHFVVFEKAENEAHMPSSALTPPSYHLLPYLQLGSPSVNITFLVQLLPSRKCSLPLPYCQAPRHPWLSNYSHAAWQQRLQPAQCIPRHCLQQCWPCSGSVRW